MSVTTELSNDIKFDDLHEPFCGKKYALELVCANDDLIVIKKWSRTLSNSGQTVSCMCFQCIQKLMHTVYACRTRKSRTPS